VQSTPPPAAQPTTAAAPTTAPAAAAPTTAAATPTAAASTASTSPTVAAAGKPGGSIVVGLDLEPDNLDPAVTPFAVSHTVMMNIYDTLVWQGTDGKFYPGLAQKWTVSPDGTTFTFNLRSDVKFHDGTPFNADAVKFTFDHIVDPASHSGFAASLLGPYDHSEVVDPSTVKVYFTGPYAPFLDSASQAFLGIVSPTAVKKDPQAFLRNPVGTGFMKFQEWVEKDHITLTRNPDYNWAPTVFTHTGPAYLDSITVRFYTDNPTRLAALESSDANLIESPVPSEIKRLRADSKYQVSDRINPGLPVVWMIDTTRPPTDDLAVRQAMNFAIDRNAVVATGMFGITKPAFGPLWSTTPYYSSQVEGLYPYDPAQAKKVLDDAGWVPGSDGIRAKNGQKLSASFANTDFSAPFAELAQAQLRSVGIDLQLMKMDVAAAFKAIGASQVNIALQGWISSDPVVLGNLFYTKNIKDGFAWTKYSDPHLDDLLSQGERTIDQAARTKIYADVQQLIMSKALILPLFGTPHDEAYQSKYQGVNQDFRNYVWLYDVHLS
jgi:peptide/nickel transport system substrate-binding protein